METNVTQPDPASQNCSGEENVYHPNGYSEQELYYTIVFCVVHFLLSFTALFGNAAILIAIWKTSSLHSPANTLLANLAVSDFAVGLIVHPVFITALLRGIYDFSSSSRTLLITALNVITSFFIGNKT